MLILNFYLKFHIDQKKTYCFYNSYYHNSRYQTTGSKYGYSDLISIN